MFGIFKNNDARIEELEEKIHDLEFDLKVKQDKIDQFDRTRELYERDERYNRDNLRHEHQTEKRQLEDTIERQSESMERLGEKIETLEILVDKSSELEARQIELSAKQAIIEAEEEAMTRFKEKLAAEHARANTLGEERYNLGFEEGELVGKAQGILEGISAVDEITGRDRQNTVDIAKAVVENAKAPKAPAVTVNNSNKES